MADEAKDTAAKESTSQISQMTASIKKFSETLGTWKGRVQTVAKQMDDWFIQPNAQMEVFESRLTGIMGDAQKAGETMRWATEFSANSPFKTLDVVEATTKMQAFGLSAQRTLGSVGDMAAVTGKPLMNAVDAMIAAQSGEIKGLEAFGITKQKLIDKSNQLGTGGISDGGEITDQAAFNTTLFAVMDEQFKGGMGAAVGTFEGMSMIITNFMGTAERELTKPVFKAMEAGLAQVITLLNRFKSGGGLEALAGIGTVLGQAMRIVSQLLVAVLDQVTQIAIYIVNNWSTIGPLIAGIAAAIGLYLVYTHGAKVAIEAWTAAHEVLNAVMKAGPMALTVLAIGLLIGAIILLIKNWDTVKAKVIEWATVASTYITGLWSKLLSFAGDLIAGVLTVLYMLFPIIGSMIIYIIQNWDQIKAYFLSLWEGMKAPIVAFVNYLISSFTAVAGWILTTFDPILVFFSDLWTIIATNLANAFGMIASWLQSVWESITTFFSDILTQALNWGANIIDTMIQGIISAKDRLVNTFMSVFSEIRKMLPFSDAKEGPFSQLTFNGGQIMATLAQGVEGNAGLLKDSVSGAMATAGVNVNPAGNAAISTMSANNVTLGTLVGTINLNDVGTKDTAKLVDELITQLHARLAEAADIAAGADKAVLV